MKYSRWPSMLAVAVTCMLLTAPMKADAASASSPSDNTSSGVSASAASKKSQKSESRSGKSEKSKKSEFSGKSEKASSSGKSAKSDKSDKPSKSRKAAKSSAKTQQVSEQGTDSRDIWLKRAQESEVFSGKASWYGRDSHGGATASGHPAGTSHSPSSPRPAAR